VGLITDKQHRPEVQVGAVVVKVLVRTQVAVVVAQAVPDLDLQ
jgi:hypothetical protein